MVKPVATHALALLALLAACDTPHATAPAPGPAVDLDALRAQGRALFEGRAGCIACHELGDLGDKVRGPNLGVGDDMTEPVGVRARTRRPELLPIEYVVESMFDPDAVVAPGYARGVMKHLDQPPIRLTDDEAVAIAVFVLSEGGTGEAIDEHALQAARARGPLARQQRIARATRDWADQRIASLRWDGADAGRGAVLYDRLGCSLCHGNPLNRQVRAPSLDDVGLRLDRSNLARWLIAPPPGRMPSYADCLGPTDLADLCTHLTLLVPRR